MSAGVGLKTLSEEQEAAGQLWKVGQFLEHLFVLFVSLVFHLFQMELSWVSASGLRLLKGSLTTNEARLLRSGAGEGDVADEVGCL